MPRARRSGTGKRNLSARSELVIPTFVFRIRLFEPSVLLASTFFPCLPSYRAPAKDAARLAPTKALKTRALATPHSAPQPPIGMDPVLEEGAAKLREAVARGALEAQQARAQEGGGDTGQSGAAVATRANTEEEDGRDGMENAARPDIKAGEGGADSAT